MYDPTPPMSCVDTSVRVSKKMHRAATTSGSRRSAHIAADRCVQAATTLRRMAIRKLRTVWTGDSEEDLDGYLSEYSAWGRLCLADDDPDLRHERVPSTDTVGRFDGGGLRGEQLPTAFGDDFYRAAVHLDGGLVVEGVSGSADAGRPAFCFGQGVLREDVQVREDGEVHDAEGAVVRRGRPLHEVIAHPRGHHHAAGTDSDPDGLVETRDQVGQTLLPHPVA